MTIVLSTKINAPIKKIWELWTNPEDIMQWNNLSVDWHTTKAENELRVGGRFLWVMALKDGSFSFDFAGSYDEVIPYNRISYTLDDGRKTTVTFAPDRGLVKLTETFEPNLTDSIDIQKDFCKAVLLGFKKYAESKVLHQE